MELSGFDIAAFVGFIAVVIGISLYASRKEETTEDYFLAGRKLTWWLIGFSLIASNISSEHFVGMAGSGFGNMGLAVAHYEWIAAVSLVIVGLVLLPRFLKAGIYTIPQFLEYRYSAGARALMAAYMMIMYVAVAFASVLYAGAVGLRSIFGTDMTLGVWLIGILAAAYTIYGGLKAVVWSDLLQGTALLIGGGIVMVLGFRAVGGVGSFMAVNADKLHLILPADHPEIPWTALIVGIWIPNLFYWGLNQFITQRTLAARSVSEGQKGIMLAAALKLIIPFIIVFPGIMAFQLYADEVPKMDMAYPTLIKHILPTGLRGVMFAALFGAVMSSLDSMLNSASTIFTMDLYGRHFRPNASPKHLVTVGRIMTAVFVVVGCLIAPSLDNPKFGGIFKYIQMFQGFISPGILTVFVVGLIFRKAPPLAAIVGLLVNIPVYGLLLWLLPEVAFLNHMAITFGVVFAVMIVITLVRPMAEPKKMPVNEDIDLRTSRLAVVMGAAVVAATAVLYAIFW
jgi:SSS family solute:Na+ symporter